MIKHSNCRPYNWLLYLQAERFLIKSRPLFGQVVYDFGCGEMPYKSLILSTSESYIGIDWSNTPHALKADIVADLNCRLPIENEIADTVVSFSVMEHLHNPKNLLDEAFRVLRPGGHIIVCVPWQWLLHEIPHDYYRFSPYVLEKMLVEAGFQNVLIESVGGFFTTVFLKINYFTTRLVRGPWALRALVQFFLLPIWTLFQVLAFVFDNFDRNKFLEAQSFWVTAQKS